MQCAGQQLKEDAIKSSKWEAYLEPSQTPWWSFFAKIVNG